MGRADVQIAGIVFVVVAVAAVCGLTAMFRRRLEEGRRLRAFVVAFALLFAISAAQEVGPASELAKGCGWLIAGVSLVLTSLGRAALAFIGGNGFALVPELPGAEPTLAWATANPVPLVLHALFQLLSLAALALTAESVLSLFTSVSSWLSLRVDRFEQVVVVVSSPDMADCARAFATDAARGEERPRAVLSVVREPDGGATYRLSSGDATQTLERDAFHRRLADAVRARSGNHVTDGHLPLVSLRNGRVTVTSFADVPLTPRQTSKFVDALMAGCPPEDDSLAPADVYSYSLEEIKVRQLMRRLLPNVDIPGDKGLGLGLIPLCAMVIGNDVERVVLLVAYLTRNGQAIRTARADGSVVAARPRIAVASSQAARVVRRLRGAYPGLFSDGGPIEGTPGATLTAPAQVTVYESKFEMLDDVQISPDDLVLVINAQADTGRAPSQREVWQRRLERRAPGVRPIYVQYDEGEDARDVFEDSYGGRTTTDDADAKRVLMYGNTSESMRAARVLHKDLDRAAMLVNLRYCLSEGEPKPSLFDPASSEDFVPEAAAQWAGCNAYGRDSSRATADFVAVERLLWQTGIGEVPGAGKGVSEKDDEALCEVIGQLEHLRWIAYMVTTGFEPRRWDELPGAYERALRENAELDSPREVRRVFKDVTLDLRAREHAALVDWEWLPALDALCERMARETGTYEELLLNPEALKPNQQKDRDIIDNLIV